MNKGVPDATKGCLRAGLTFALANFGVPPKGSIRAQKAHERPAPTIPNAKINR